MSIYINAMRNTYEWSERASERARAFRGLHSQAMRKMNSNSIADDAACESAGETATERGRRHTEPNVSNMYRRTPHIRTGNEQSFWPTAILPINRLNYCLQYIRIKRHAHTHTTGRTTSAASISINSFPFIQSHLNWDDPRTRARTQTGIRTSFTRKQMKICTWTTYIFPFIEI